MLFSKSTQHALRILDGGGVDVLGSIKDDMGKGGISN